MNLSELQAELRHFAAERDWQPFHTPKNLSMALMVEAAELAEIFQWMTPEESAGAQTDAATKARIGEEVADVLLYLLQLADYNQIDIARATREKLARNALQYPAKQAVARVSPARAAQAGVHVLLDYENVQPTEADLRDMVPEANQVWVFHGPHQQKVQQRFASFGDKVTAVPISRTGKNALDFHLSFYLGYIASRNQASEIVVVANDKGYGPMIEHARAMGFAVRQLGYGQRLAVAPTKAKEAVAAKAGAAPKSVTMKAATKKLPAKKAAVKKVQAKKVPAPQRAAKKVPARKVATKKAAAKQLPVAGKATAQTARKAPAKKVVSLAPLLTPPPANPVSVSADSLKKITENLRKMGNRPVKEASLRRALKSLLGVETEHASIDVALADLTAKGVILLDQRGNVLYPGFVPRTGTWPT